MDYHDKSQVCLSQCTLYKTTIFEAQEDFSGLFTTWSLEKNEHI